MTLLRTLFQVSGNKTSLLGDTRSALLPSLVKGPLVRTVALDSRKGKLVDAQPIEVPYDTERRFAHKVTNTCRIVPLRARNIM